MAFVRAKNRTKKNNRHPTEGSVFKNPPTRSHGPLLCTKHEALKPGNHATGLGLKASVEGEQSATKTHAHTNRETRNPVHRLLKAGPSTHLPGRCLWFSGSELTVERPLLEA